MITNYIIEKEVELNGKDAGIGIEINGQVDHKRLFKNRELARSYLANEKGIYDPKQYKLCIIMGKNVVPFEFVQEVVRGNEKWLDFYANKGLYHFKETFSKRISSIGYYVFNLEELENKVDAIKRNSHLFRTAENACDTLVKFPNIDPAIVELNRINYNHFSVKLKGCTGEVHILKNKEIVEINKQRMTNQVRVIPFDKSVNTLNSIFVYTVKEASESKFYNVEGKLQKIVEYILDMLTERFECEYIPVDFIGNIYV